MMRLSININALLLRFGFTLIIILSSLSLWAAPEAPEFVRTKNWEIEKLTSGHIIMTTTAVLFNPNNAKARLKDVDIDIWLGETKTGKVVQAKKRIKIRKRSAFEIPLRIDLEPETSGWGYISGLLAAATFQDSVIKLKGRIKIKVLGLPVSLRIDEEEDINLRDLL